MFTGFASENTPAVQVWNFYQGTGVNSVSLADDCAPIQFLKTGGTTNSISLYLPSAPIEGKPITIITARFGTSNQSVNVYAPDANNSAAGNVPIFTLGSAESLTIFYSKDNISFGTAAGAAETGWIGLNKGAPTSATGYGIVSGGNYNTANAKYSSVVGGEFNSALSTYSAVIGGNGNYANFPSSVVIGGTNNRANSVDAVVVGGVGNAASGFRAAVVGGVINTAEAEYSIVLGGGYGTGRAIVANCVTPASLSPISLTSGATQAATLLLGRQTTDATATVLTSNSSAAGTTNQVILPNNSAYTFQGTCIANVTGGGNTSGWKFEGVIKRGANAASTVLVATVTPTVIAQDAGASTWVLAITADTTNGGIAVTVTGQAATTIRWVAKIETTEVTY